MVAAGLRARLDRPVDAAGAALFRVAFGLAMVAAAVRYFARGLIAADYGRAHDFLPYWGLSFIRPWPGVGMYVLWGLIGVAALALALGIAYRAAVVAFFVGFTWAHLCDRANYLNHYYLVSLLALICCFLPLDREYSLRVWISPAARRPQLRAWMHYLLRFQIGVVYLFGGIAKIGGDWLLHGEPLKIWLRANADLPVWGHLVRQPWLPLAMSWGGLAFDLSIVPLLSWRRTRVPAYAMAVVFHALTAELFPIGMFPWIMSIGATLFFAPDWPRRILGPARGEGVAGAPLGRMGLWIVAIYVAIQILVPLRHFLYPGNTLWTEEGFRWSWRVMLIEKSGDCAFTVVDKRSRHIRVSPRQYLTPFQTRMTCTQPDMIVDMAHLIAVDFAARGQGPVQVYADAQVSWNGRRHAPLIDPTVDLARQSDSLMPKRWILPAPTSEPQF